MEKTETETTEPVLVPIISRRVGNVWLPFYEHAENRSESQAAAQRQMVILPGLNWKPADQIRKCGPLRARSLNVNLRAADPTKLDPDSKLELIGMTTSRDALRRWREIEKDEDIVAAIDDKLGHRAA
ncbi:MAG: hypothetical protein VYA51_12720 [Planctomycetota bacterium]|nr:hypothetical protein [Planctomycetota bacterium]